MKRVVALALTMHLALLAGIIVAAAQGASPQDGQKIFRYDTFGDEQLWTRTLRMQEAIATVPPATALEVGLKVDVEALPAAVVEALKAGKVNLKDPAVTLQLLSANAVVGVVGKVNGKTLESIGITCALCHSTVDNSFTKGIGKRLDGWPNRDLNVGAIVALSPAVTEAQRAVFKSWGPGKYDPRMHAFDGTKFLPLNTPSLPVVIPPAYGLRNVGFETFTGDGPVSYWNAYVGITQMGGQGTFEDSRIKLSVKQTPDLVTPKLPALLQYQLSIAAPPPPPGSFDKAAAGRGEQLFNSSARCASCHVGPAFTDVTRGKDPKTPLLHSAKEIGATSGYVSRSATKMFRTAPLRGVWQHPPYFHDGRAADLLAVVNHYDKLLSLGLTAAQKADLVEYLKSL